MFGPFPAYLEKLDDEVIDPPELVFVIETDHAEDSVFMQRFDGSLGIYAWKRLRMKSGFQIQRGPLLERLQ